MSYLIILGCLQVMVDQLKVQTIFLLQGSMELCFLKNKQGRGKIVKCVVTLRYITFLIAKTFMPECITHVRHTVQLHLKTITSAADERLRLVPIPPSVSICECVGGLSFSFRSCLEDKTHSCTLSPSIWYVALGM